MLFYLHTLLVLWFTVNFHSNICWFNTVLKTFPFQCLLRSVNLCIDTIRSLQILAKSLAEHGIDTTVIADSAVFAMMARVNKVC